MPQSQFSKIVYRLPDAKGAHQCVSAKSAQAIENKEDDLSTNAKERKSAQVADSGRDMNLAPEAKSPREALS